METKWFKACHRLILCYESFIDYIQYIMTFNRNSCFRLKSAALTSGEQWCYVCSSGNTPGKQSCGKAMRSRSLGTLMSSVADDASVRLLVSPLAGLSAARSRLFCKQPRKRQLYNLYVKPLCPDTQHYQLHKIFSDKIAYPSGVKEKQTDRTQL